jgi:hypothetical protein
MTLDYQHTTKCKRMQSLNWRAIGWILKKGFVSAKITFKSFHFLPDRISVLLKHLQIILKIQILSAHKSV